MSYDGSAVRGVRPARLLLILVAQCAASLWLMHANGMFEDEARFAYDGHQELQAWFYGVPDTVDYSAILSGAPYFYLVVSALLDHLGGLFAIRLFGDAATYSSLLWNAPVFAVLLFAAVPHVGWRRSLIRTLGALGALIALGLHFTGHNLPTGGDGTTADTDSALPTHLGFGAWFAAAIAGYGLTVFFEQYYLRGQPNQRQWYDTGSSFSYKDPDMGATLSGTAAYADAIRHDYFNVVELLGVATEPADQALAEQLVNTEGYLLVAQIPYCEHGSTEPTDYYEIWVLDKKF